MPSVQHVRALLEEAWEASVLPLNYARSLFPKTHPSRAPRDHGDLAGQLPGPSLFSVAGRVDSGNRFARGLTQEIVKGELDSLETVL